MPEVFVIKFGAIIWILFVSYNSKRESEKVLEESARVK